MNGDISEDIPHVDADIFSESLIRNDPFSKISGFMWMWHFVQQTLFAVTQLSDH